MDRGVAGRPWRPVRTLARPAVLSIMVTCCPSDSSTTLAPSSRVLFSMKVGWNPARVCSSAAETCPNKAKSSARFHRCVPARRRPRCAATSAAAPGRTGPPDRRPRAPAPASRSTSVAAATSWAKAASSPPTQRQSSPWRISGRRPCSTISPSSRSSAFSAWLTPQLRHASAGERRRHPRHPGAARPCPPVDDGAVHAGLAGHHRPDREPARAADAGGGAARPTAGRHGRRPGGGGRLPAPRSPMARRAGRSSRPDAAPGDGRDRSLPHRGARRACLPLPATAAMPPSPITRAATATAPNARPGAGGLPDMPVPEMNREHPGRFVGFAVALAHMRQRSVVVEEGDRVRAGDPIGEWETPATAPCRTCTSARSAAFPKGAIRRRAAGPDRTFSASAKLRIEFP